MSRRFSPILWTSDLALRYIYVSLSFLFSFFILVNVNCQLTDIKRGGRVVGVAGTRVPRLENEAGNASILDNVTPAGVGDVVGRAQHGRRRISISISISISIPVTVLRPISDALPGTTIGAGHATWSSRFHLGQTSLAFSTAYFRTICALC